jgi:hypothetical protein
VGTSLQLKDVFDGPNPRAIETHDLREGEFNLNKEYSLTSMFCYYGQHYFAFIYKPEVWGLGDLGGRYCCTSASLCPACTAA